MNKEALITAIKTSTSEVLETMFFMPVDFLSAGKEITEPSSNGGDVAVRLDFSGPDSGCFRLRVPAPLARDVSIDFLGIDHDQLTDDDVAGTVKEMINMLAGNTLSLYDADAVFDLGVPEVDTGTDGTRDCSRQPASVALEVLTLASRMTVAVDYRD